MTNDGSPHLQQSTSYARSNKKPRLVVPAPPQDLTSRSGHQSVFFTRTSSSPSLQSVEVGYNRKEHGIDIDYHFPPLSTSNLKVPQFPFPHSSSPLSPTQPSPYRPCNYPLLYPPSSEPSTPSVSPSPRPTFRSPSSSDPSSCNTPPTYQGFSNLDSYHSHCAPIYNRTVPLVGPCLPGDQDIMFDAFMEAIEQDSKANLKAPKSHAMMQARLGFLEGNFQFIPHRDTTSPGPANLASNALVHHPGSEKGAADWFQVLSQNAHLVNLNLKPDSENPVSPGLVGFSELTHGASMFCKPARIF